LPPLGCWQPVCSADVARSSNSYTSEGYGSHRFQYGAAAKAFDEALKADPNDAQAYNGQGIVRMCTGHYAASIADYSSAIRLNPQWFDYKNRAASHEETGDYARALADINEAIALEPKDPVLSHSRRPLRAERPLGRSFIVPPASAE
jgi:tetratricopeptide (TPR) repeat protein